MDVADEVGHTNYLTQQKSAIIKITKLNDYLRRAMITPCQEKTLVHELLHLKYNLVKNDAYEGIYLEINEHALLEQMARSLVMAKYNLTPDWFNNVD